MAQPQTKPMSPQDESLWFKVRVEMKINPLTESFAKELKYHVSRGVVTVEGQAPSPEAVRAIDRVVMNVVGVTGVVNKVTAS